MTWVGSDPADLNNNDYDFYSRSSWYECKLEHWLSWLEDFVVPLRLSMQVQGWSFAVFRVTITQRVLP
jgi:hypothetical protein